jgi:hypothetical protein
LTTIRQPITDNNLSVNKKVVADNSFIHQLNPVYFWDLDYVTLDPVKSRRIIIERVLTLGNLNEVKLVTCFYGKEVVINTLCGLNYLDSKTLNFFSMVFEVPKSHFKCYKKRQSTGTRWI